MIRLDRVGPVTRLRMSTWRSRSIGYEVSAYFAHGVLIDCGFPRVAAQFEHVAAGLRPDGAIITHGHEDHAGNVTVLARLGIPIAIAADTLVELRAAPHIRMYRSYTWGQPRAFTAAFVPFDPAPLQLIRAPGHCPDHRMVWDAAHGTLYSADLWLGVHDKLVHTEENPRQLVHDLRAAAALAPDFMFDSHRGPVHEPARALTAKADWLGELIGKIDRDIAKGMSDGAIVRAELGGEEFAGVVSRAEYSRANLVRNLRASAAHSSPTHQ